MSRQVPYPKLLGRIHGAHRSIEWDVHKKTIGRNEGCVVSCETLGTYYIKQQPLCLRTMLVYHLLRRVGCGPAEVYFTAENSGEEEVAFHHCVATSEIQGFRMRSTDAQQRLPVEEAMLLVILVSLCNLGDIPSNGDNWGIQEPSRRLALVDFSFRTVPDVALMGEGLFVDAYKQFCEPNERRERNFDQDRAAFLQSYGTWFGSDKAFSALVESAMDDVCAWVNDAKGQEAWRESLGFMGAMPLLDQLNNYHGSLNRYFRLFSKWFNNTQDSC